MHGNDSGEEGGDSTECWYWVQAKYKAVHLGAARRRHIWETTVFLIRGPRVYEITIPAAVKNKAEEMARAKEHQYEASGGHTLRWVFQYVSAMAPLVNDEIVEGTEVYWEIYTKVDKQVLESSVASRSDS